MDLRIEHPSAVQRLAQAARATFTRGERADGVMHTYEALLHRAFEVAARHGSVRSHVMNTAVFATWSSVRALVKGLQGLDDVFYPEWRDQEVKPPLFLVANARSGTTLLHGLMALDEERFVTMRLFETLFPTVTGHRIIDAVARSDERLFGGAFGKAKALLERTALGGWQDIHPLKLNGPEEDECVFVYTLHTTTLGLLLPEMAEYEEHLWFDSLPLETRQTFLAYYEDVVRRHMFSRAKDKRYLNKNVFMTTRMRSLSETFPDAQFVYLIRHPYESIGSYLDMFHRAWAVHRPDVAKDSPEARVLAKMAIKQYRYAMTCRQLMDDDKFVLVKYDDLVADPKATVEGIYTKLGIPVSRAFASRLEAATKKHRTFKSEHEYALDDFGVSRDEIYEELSDIFEQFGFKR